MLESCLWPALVCALLNPSLFGKEKPKRKQEKEGGKRGQQMSSGFFLRRRGVVRGSPLPRSSCFSPARCPSAVALRWTAAPSTSAIWRSRQPHQLVTSTTSSVRPHFLGAAGTLNHTRRHPHYASGQPEQQQVPPPARPPWRAFTLLPLHAACHTLLLQEKKEREDFVRSYLHLLAQEAFFFDDETWQVLGVHHVPGSGTEASESRRGGRG